jgi:putative membrane protein
MPSERRLHPTTILFGLVGQLREFAVPIVALLVAGSSRSGFGMELAASVLLIPYGLLAVARYHTFRYVFADTELVIRSGIISTNERHIPYARIQNLDARQNLFHRAFGVMAARIDTGSGNDADATLSVITRDAYEEIRERVFAERRDATAGDDARPAGDLLLTLPTRELVIHGLIENRGMIVLAGIVGLVVQSGVDDRLYERLADDARNEQGAIRQFIGRATEIAAGANGIVLGILLVLVALVMIRLLSVAIAIVRLHGFRLERIGEDLRAGFGLLTRVSSTIPLRRVQTVTVSAGLLHRWAGRVSIRVDTAGGEGSQVQQRRRESLAPILPADAVPGLLAAVLPEIDLGSLTWYSAADGATGRELRRRLVVAAVVSAAAVYPLGWYAAGLFAALAGLAWFSAVRYVRSLGWTTVDGAVLHRSGWLTRHMTIARFTRVQAVSMVQSPFDRRFDMARVFVDTAGATGSPHRVHIPYMTGDAARGLYTSLAAAASRTTFRW